jgi:putative Mg2+ transporter-C (MgtC) family protein
MSHNQFLLELPLSKLDPTRISAAIVTGVGFLGAGFILRDGTLRGMTNAASAWVF